MSNEAPLATAEIGRSSQRNRASTRRIGEQWVSECHDKLFKCALHTLLVIFSFCASYSGCSVSIYVPSKTKDFPSSLRGLRLACPRLGAIIRPTRRVSLYFPSPSSSPLRLVAPCPAVLLYRICSLFWSFPSGCGGRADASPSPGEVGLPHRQPVRRHETDAEKGGHTRTDNTTRDGRRESEREAHTERCSNPDRLLTHPRPCLLLLWWSSVPAACGVSSPAHAIRPARCSCAPSRLQCRRRSAGSSSCWFLVRAGVSSEQHQEAPREQRGPVGRQCTHRARGYSAR